MRRRLTFRSLPICLADFPDTASASASKEEVPTGRPARLVFVKHGSFEAVEIV